MLTHRFFVCAIKNLIVLDSDYFTFQWFDSELEIENCQDGFTLALNNVAKCSGYLQSLT